MKDQVNAGIRIEIISIIWMVIEAVVSIWGGWLAGSALLMAFGLDSIIELISATALLWRLTVEAKGQSTVKVAKAETNARWTVAIALALLCLYVIATSVYGLYAHIKPNLSISGFIITLAAAIGMPLLSRKKRKIAAIINSKALTSDASCTMVCAYMALSVLSGLLLNFLFGWWWAEHIAAFLFLYWLYKETREAFEIAQNKTDSCSCC